MLARHQNNGSKKYGQKVTFFKSGGKLGRNVERIDERKCSDG